MATAECSFCSAFGDYGPFGTVTICNRCTRRLAAIILEGDDGDVWADNALAREERAGAELLSRFRAAVSTNISVTDSDSHLNIAVAYREMGLYRDAVREGAIALDGAQSSAAINSILELLLSAPLLRPRGAHELWTRIVKRLKVE